MIDNVAIYRPEDIPTDAFDWDVAFGPIIQLLSNIGVTPTLPQKRLHPDWRDQEKQGSIQSYDVVEVAVVDFVEHRRKLELLGFVPWPDTEDSVSSLYGYSDEY